MAEHAEGQNKAKLLEDEVPWAGNECRHPGPQQGAQRQEGTDAERDPDGLGWARGVQALQDVLRHHVPKCPLQGGVSSHHT